MIKLDSDWKTTLVFFVFVICMLYSLYTDSFEMAFMLSGFVFSIWYILKTNSKELLRDLVTAFKEKWSK